VNVEKADARFRDGVLEIVLPKVESAKPKVLTIK
jgi:HSP20 family molecular chaperone IbpA